MKRQIISIAFALFLICGNGTLFAQHKHEFSVHGGAGLSSLNYSPSVGERTSGFGGQFGFGYNYFFTPKWGIGTGAEVAFYNANLKINNFNTSSRAVDIEGVEFEFRSVVNDFEEKQRVTLLQIPLMLRYQTEGRRQFYTAAGVKVGIPLSGKYDTSASLRNCGYYEFEVPAPCYDTQEFMGFGNFPGQKAGGDPGFKTAIFASAEAGVKLKQSERLSLNIGAFLDYGLNNILKEQTLASMSPVVEYNRAYPRSFALNGAINSQHQGVGAPQAFIDKMRPIAVGVKVSLSFGKN